MRTLVFLKTHYINDFVLNELDKLKACSGKSQKTILFIDNHVNFLNINDNGIKHLIFNNKRQECFVFDKDVFSTMGLPYYTNKSDNVLFSKLMWYCCDYPIYVIRKFYPDYDYYWQIESDVFFNGKNYKPFFSRFKNDNRDLLLTLFSEYDLSKSPNKVPQNDDWVYHNQVRGAGFFPVVRLSAKAADICYKKRLEHVKLFEKFKDNPDNRWVYSENFVATECVQNGLNCGSLNEMNIRFMPRYKKEDIPEADNKIYHPLKNI